jgi:hypothetical protein
VHAALKNIDIGPAFSGFSDGLWRIPLTYGKILRARRHANGQTREGKVKGMLSAGGLDAAVPSALVQRST